MASITRVEGIGDAYGGRLRAAGVATTGALLRTGATRAGRERLAADSGIAHALILEWVNHVDLWRVKGVAEEYSDLLERSGVNTVPDLARRKAASLRRTVVEVNRNAKLVRRLPSEAQLAGWIAQAKELPRVVSY